MTWRDARHGASDTVWTKTNLQAWVGLTERHNDMTDTATGVAISGGMHPLAGSVPIGKGLLIRGCGFDEYWLQDRIAEDPSCLGLGDLAVHTRERRQAGGGRVDILLVNPEDNAMYEVEVMLGDTDETHIIRTLEYWDNEKRRWPQRQHFAVLVAERITRRFFNVIQLLSHAVPVIAIQANIVEADGRRILHFTTVLDTYVEPEATRRGGSVQPEIGEDYWKEESPWTLENAKLVLAIVQKQFPNAKLNCVKTYITILLDGDSYVWLHKRGNGRSILNCWFNDQFFPEATALLDASGLAYINRSIDGQVRLTVDKSIIESKGNIIAKLTELVGRSWCK